MIKLPDLGRLPAGRKGGWILAALVLGLYFFLKLQGWWLAARVGDLEKKLEEVRPVLSTILFSEQMEANRQAYGQVFDEVGRLKVDGSKVLSELSKKVPASIWLQALEADSAGLTLKASCLPGVRKPESVTAAFSKGMQEWAQVEIEGPVQDTEAPGIWRFSAVLKPPAEPAKPEAR